MNRLKKARKSYWGRDFKLDPRQLGIVVTTPKNCGCWMCSNTRELEGDTIQEIKQRLYAESFDTEA